MERERGEMLYDSASKANLHYRRFHQDGLYGLQTELGQWPVSPRSLGLLPNSNSRWCVSDPLPPSAALPLTEGENKPSHVGGVISPS